MLLFADLAAFQATQGAHHQIGAKTGKLIGQFARAFAPNGNALGHQDGTGIEPLIHMHHHHAGLGITRHHGALDGRGAAPARQQGAMQIEAAQPGRIQNGFGQQQAVSDHHRGIEAQRRKGGLFVGAFQGKRSANVQARRLGKFVHWAGGGLHAAAAGARRLGIDGGDVMALGDQFGQRRNREVRCAHECQAQCHQTAAFFALVSFLSSMARLSLERWSMKSTPSR